MKFYGIKTPELSYQKSYIWWISDSKHASWNLFFTYPNKHGQHIPYRPALEEAIRAYEAIGYKCVELEVKEVTS